MALDRWIALVILGVALAYGYAAFFLDGPPLAAIYAAQPSLAINFSQNPIGSGNIDCFEYFIRCGKARQRSDKTRYRLPKIARLQFRTGFFNAGDDGALCFHAAPFGVLYINNWIFKPVFDHTWRTRFYKITSDHRQRHVCHLVPGRANIGHILAATARIFNGNLVC